MDDDTTPIKGPINQPVNDDPDDNVSPVHGPIDEPFEDEDNEEPGSNGSDL